MRNAGYAGVGLFCLPLAERFDEVTAADSSTKAFRSLRFNAERAGRRVRVVHANVEEFLPSVTGSVDLVIADPPRSGLGPRVTAELARIKPSSLVIVSCDPATLARDLRVLRAYRPGDRIDDISRPFPANLSYGNRGAAAGECVMIGRGYLRWEQGLTALMKDAVRNSRMVHSTHANPR